MVQQARASLLKTLAILEAQRAKTETQIKAVRAALSALGLNSPHLAGRRRRKPMTPAERKSVSRRMKAYWAKRRAKKTNKA